MITRAIQKSYQCSIVTVQPIKLCSFNKLFFQLLQDSNIKSYVRSAVLKAQSRLKQFYCPSLIFHFTASFCERNFTVRNDVFRNDDGNDEEEDDDDDRSEEEEEEVPWSVHDEEEGVHDDARVQYGNRVHDGLRDHVHDHVRGHVHDHVRVPH